MPLSRYPRPGCRLAPEALRELLKDMSAPPELLGQADTEPIRLADLDESAWTRFGPEDCRLLAEELVNRVRVALYLLPEYLQNQALPRLPKDIQLEQLQLMQRTYNCLHKMQFLGRLQEVRDLGDVTIGEVLSIGGFGAKCLVDLLTSMETVFAHGLPASTPIDRNADGLSGPVHYGLFHHRGAAVKLSAVRKLRLPKIPEGATLRSLRLDQRTLNCLERHGFHDRLRELEEQTVGEMLALTGFGDHCLSDLLRAIDVFDPAAAEPAEPEVAELTPVEHSALEDELDYLIAHSSKFRFSTRTDRNVRIAAQHYGFDGAGGATLNAVGEVYDISRERVRQICFRFEREVKHKKCDTPLLDKAFISVASRLPAPAEVVEAALQQEGITRSKFRLEGLLKAARFLERNPPLALAVIDGERWVVAPKGWGLRTPGDVDT
jgi:Bacterial RNA polymerase, alpha chain C terminal domain